jgi:hypothetical protein
MKKSVADNLLATILVDIDRTAAAISHVNRRVLESFAPKGARCES